MDKLAFILSKNWSIFPCVSKGKKPITKNGFKDASPERIFIEKWLKENPGCNIAIPTGKVNGITVLDVDKKYGGFYSLEKFKLPDTPYVETGGGGRHYYFKYDPKAKTGANRLGPGLDIRNDGAYVIAPPSLHSSGNEYVWCDEGAPLADPPVWLSSDLFEKESKDFKIDKWPIPQGRQDDTLFRLVCSLRHKNPPGVVRDMVKGIIDDPEKCPQDPANPFTDKDIERWIRGAWKHEDIDTKRPEAVIFLNPVDCVTFKQKDIPEVEFYVDGILQKRGRTMISAKSNTGKSFFLINMLASVCSGQEKSLGYFENDMCKPKALYLDFEMGESALQERLTMMGKFTDLPNLFVQSLYGWNMLDKTYQTALEDIITARGIDIIAFDPLGSMWLGDENKRESVKELTDYLDYVMDKYNASIIITHHWRKASKDFREGAEMAAGSYGWGKWLDNHITLQGEIESLVVSSQKNRNQKKWEQIRVTLDEETLLFKYQGVFKNTKEYTDEDLLGIFNSFGKAVISKPELLKKGKAVCSPTTLRRLLEGSKYLRVNKTKKPHIITRTEEQPEFLEEQKEWEE